VTERSKKLQEMCHHPGVGKRALNLLQNGNLAAVSEYFLPADEALKVASPE